MRNCLINHLASRGFVVQKDFNTSQLPDRIRQVKKCVIDIVLEVEPLFGFCKDSCHVGGGIEKLRVFIPFTDLQTGRVTHTEISIPLHRKETVLRKKDTAFGENRME